MLFHETIFGPIHSRRLGTSLGVNLTPDDGKICSFDCIYCEAGWNSQGPGTTGFAPVDKVASLLDARLAQMRQAGDPLDVITFSGNGEPTLHPEFPAVVEQVTALRDKYYPQARVSVLTNSTRLGDPAVAEALLKVDNNILKLDSALTETIRLIDQPNNPGFSAEAVIDQLKQFAGTGIIQTMMLRGEFGGRRVDNTTDAEVEALIAAYKAIAPREIMLYSIDRPTPARQLEKVSADELRAIGSRIAQATSIPVQVN